MANISEDIIDEYLREQMGPPNLPMETAVPFTVVFVIIFISGLLGNIAVCLVITQHRAMHTATNYYLFNLAISDLILLIFGEYECSLRKYFSGKLCSRAEGDEICCKLNCTETLDGNWQVKRAEQVFETMNVKTA